MRARISWLVLACAAVAASGQPAAAQLLDQLKGAAGGAQGTAGSALGGGLPAVGQASTGNTAGVLQYCIRNNYLSGGSATSVQNSLLSKVTGSGQGTNDSGYRAGSNGVLQTGNGQDYSLSGNGIKQQAAQKVCDMVLQHAKSLL